LILAGFVRRVKGTATGNGWDHTYDLSYFFGFFMSGIVHWALHTAFPAEKQTGSSPFEMELHRTRQYSEAEVLHASVDSTTSHDDDNVPIRDEKTVSV
jgi:nucleobase:cation symporter-1, NCS1 family